MRLLILASAATLIVTGAAMAHEPVHHHVMHHHYHNASAPIDEGASADTLSAHDMHMKNLHDSGYDPHHDFDAYGNVQTAQ